MRLAVRPVTLFAAFLVAGCGGNLASELAKPPEYAPEGQTQCKVAKSQERPLIVEWPSADRLALEAHLRQRPVVVHYDGCEMKILRSCRAPGVYRYLATTRQDDVLHIRTEDELYANIPVFAAKFEARLRNAGELTVRMSMVGTYELGGAVISHNDLSGSCDAATHVVSSAIAGAFEFTAGANAEIGGAASVSEAQAGARSAAAHELLNRAGDMTTCVSASGDQMPPDGCGAILRLEVSPVTGPVRAITQPVPNSAPASAAKAKPVVPGSPGTMIRIPATDAIKVGPSLKPKDAYSEWWHED